MPLEQKLKEMLAFMDSDKSENKFMLIGHLSGVLGDLMEDDSVVTKEMLELFDTDEKRKILLTSFITLLMRGVSVNFGE